MSPSKKKKKKKKFIFILLSAKKFFFNKINSNKNISVIPLVTIMIMAGVKEYFTLK